LQIIGFVASFDVLVIVEEPKERPFKPAFSIFYCTSLEEGPVKSYEVDIDESIASIATYHRQQVVPICLHRETSTIAAMLRTSDDQFTLFCWKRDGTLLSEEILDDAMFQSDTNIQMSFHSNENLICVQGPSAFWLYRLVEVKGNWSFRLINFPLQKFNPSEEGNLTCHCWIIDSKTTIILGTDSGNILITEVGKKVFSMNVGFPVESLLGLCSGFVVGGPDSTCRIYSRSSVELEFSCKNAFTIKDSSIIKDIKLKSMAISHSNDKICVFLSEVNEIFTLDFNQSDDTGSDCFVQVALWSWEYP
jgi:hypothetical protein